MPARRFPPCERRLLIVRDKNGHALAYVYFESDPSRRTAANLLTRDEARCEHRQAAQLAGPPAVLISSA
jgi:hypothetical protein